MTYVAMDAWKSVQGFMHPTEIAELQRLADMRRVLEIGSWKGRSAVGMLATAASVVSIDHFRGDSYTGKANTFPECYRNRTLNKAWDVWQILIGDVKTVLPLVRCDGFDFVHVDADHTYEATEYVLTALGACGLRDSAAVAVHDYDTKQPQYKGLVRATDDFIETSGRVLRVVHRLAVLEPAAGW